MKTEVWFMSGAGNLFTVLDNTRGQFTKDEAAGLATDLCRNHSIQRKPTEGLLLLNKSKKTDFECWFFNPDGSSGMMCGNGARCIVAFAKHIGYLKPAAHYVEFLMNGPRYTCIIEGDQYEIGFDKPTEAKSIELNIDSLNIQAVYVDNTSQHLCIDFNNFNEDENFDSFPIEDLSKRIQGLKEFPNSVNVNYYSVNPSGVISLRTFERGVDAETGACGTGALATGVAIDLNYRIKRPYRIFPTSKIPLEVDLRGENHYLKGPAEILGKIEMEL